MANQYNFDNITLPKGLTMEDLRILLALDKLDIFVDPFKPSIELIRGENEDDSVKPEWLMTIYRPDASPVPHDGESLIPFLSRLTDAHFLEWVWNTQPSTYRADVIGGKFTILYEDKEGQ